MKLFRFFFGLFLLNAAVFSQKIQIIGSSKYPLEEVSIYWDKSVFAESLVFLANGKTDDKGNFDLSFLAKEKYQKIRVVIQNIQSDFWVEMDLKKEKIYTIIFPNLKKKQHPTQYLPYHRSLGFRNLDPKDINLEMAQFDQKNTEFSAQYRRYFDYFSASMGEMLQKNDSISTREILIEKMILQQTKYQDEFMIAYQNYFNAKIALLLKIPRDQIYKQYLAPLNKAINYSFFYDFFEKFYKNFIDLPSFILYKEAYLTAIANKSPLSKIESILSSNAFLQKKEFRLLFFLGHLKDLYLQKKIEKEVFMFYIQDMMHKNIFASIAQSYWDKWIKTTKNQDFPSDLWKDIAKKFPNFEGKKTKKYFIFTNTACMVCVKEIQILNTYSQKDSTIEFLIIHLGKISEEEKKILYKNIKIPIFYTEEGMNKKSKDWVKECKIEEVPSYMFIDEQQKILAFPAYGPHPDYHGRSLYDLLPQFKDSLN